MTSRPNPRCQDRPQAECGDAIPLDQETALLFLGKVVPAKSFFNPSRPSSRLRSTAALSSSRLPAENGITPTTPLRGHLAERARPGEGNKQFRLAHHLCGVVEPPVH